MKTTSFIAAAMLGILLAAPAVSAAGADSSVPAITAISSSAAGSFAQQTASSIAHYHPNVDGGTASHPAEADRSTRHDGGMSRQDFEAFRLKKLQEIATYFGIKTEGKTAAQLKKEVELAKSANKEKWEAFKAEHKAERMTHLRRIAEQHGIKTEGKTFEQLREELHKLHEGKPGQRSSKDKA